MFIKYYFLLLYTMKVKISVSMEEDTIKKIESTLKKGIYRNKSHLIELATKEFIEGNKK